MYILYIQNFSWSLQIRPKPLRFLMCLRWPPIFVTTTPSNSMTTMAENVQAIIASTRGLHLTSSQQYKKLMMNTVQRNWIELLWLSYQCCLNAIIEHHGGNGYIMSHMNKAKLERENRLPFVIQTTAAAEKFIIEQSDSDESEYDEEGDKENMLSAVIWERNAIVDRKSKRNSPKNNDRNEMNGTNRRLILPCTPL